MWALRTSGRDKCPCCPSIGYTYICWAQVWAFFYFNLLLCFILFFIILGGQCPILFFFCGPPGPPQFLVLQGPGGGPDPPDPPGSPALIENFWEGEDDNGHYLTVKLKSGRPLRSRGWPWVQQCIRGVLGQGPQGKVAKANFLKNGELLLKIRVFWFMVGRVTLSHWPQACPRSPLFSL